MTTADLAGNLTTFSLTFETITCYRCGIPFAVPKNYKSMLVKSEENFYCPNGHCQAYHGESEETKLKRQLQRTQNELSQTVAAKIQLDSQLTKMKKDISVGKCPCCDKVYKHLAAHMKNKHPKGR